MRLLECILNSMSVIGRKLSAAIRLTLSPWSWVSGAALGLQLAQLLPQPGPLCAWCPAPRGKTSDQISEQQVVFESSLSHLQILNSFNMSVVLVLFYVIKRTWSNLAIEHLLATREQKVPVWCFGPCKTGSCFASARLNSFIFLFLPTTWSCEDSSLWVRFLRWKSMKSPHLKCRWKGKHLWTVSTKAL